MVKKRVVLVGDTFEFWKVIEVPEKGAFIKCLCLGCDITSKMVERKNLFSGGSRSCGCKSNEFAKQTSFQKYGVDSYLKSSQAQQKLKQTFLKRYGQDNASKINEVKQKKKDTCLKNFGVEYPQQSSQIKEKSNKSNLEKYGVSRPLQSEEIRQKYKDTCQEKYGVDNFSKTDEYKEKYVATCLDRFGFDHPAKSSLIRERSESTLLKKYGTKNFIKKWNMENSINHSKGELELLEWVKQWYPSVKSCRIGKFELDVFVPDIGLGIEYNGLYTHTEDGIKRRGFKGSAKNYHLEKTQHFINNNTRTIHIWDFEWIKKKEKVKSYLLSCLGKNENKIGARKCSIVWSNSKKEIQKAHQLLDSTHIQGFVNSTKYVANAYYQNELIAVATFSKHHRNSKEWVLSRFTTKTNYTIQGILSKISKLASKELQSDIISWADYRLSQGNGYKKAGWKFEKLLPPDYFYSIGNHKVISKQARQKKTVGTPENMTEAEHAIIDGLKKVWDCGKIRFKYIYKPKWAVDL